MLKQQLIQLIEQKFPKASEILRMTKVEQCYNTMSRDGKFCAMGAIYNFFGWDGITWDDPRASFDYNLVVEQLGLAEYDRQEFRKKDGSMNITRMNDRHFMSFAEIADHLEKEGL